MWILNVVPVRRMRPKESLTDFVSFLPIGQHTETSVCSLLNATPSDLDRSILSGCRMEVPLEGRVDHA